MANRKKQTVCSVQHEYYKRWTSVNLRYGDTDRQGHINNAVYCTLMESGRVDFLFTGDQPIGGSSIAFVIAKLTIDYLHEMNYPGTAQVGSAVLEIGRTSFKVGQAIFKDGVCCSTAESIIVLIDALTHKPVALTEELVEVLNEMMFSAVIDEPTIE